MHQVGGTHCHGAHLFGLVGSICLFCAFCDFGTLHFPGGEPLCHVGQLPCCCIPAHLGIFLISAHLGFGLLLTWQALADLAPPLATTPKIDICGNFSPLTTCIFCSQLGMCLPWDPGHLLISAHFAVGPGCGRHCIAPAPPPPPPLHHDLHFGGHWLTPSGAFGTAFTWAVLHLSCWAYGAASG